MLRGTECLGAKQHLHTTRILSLSSDLPVLIEFVDQVEDGLITLERVEVISHRAEGSQGSTNEG